MCYSLMQSCGLIIDHPMGTPEWHDAKRRLDARSSGGGGAAPVAASVPATAKRGAKRARGKKADTE